MRSLILIRAAAALASAGAAAVASGGGHDPVLEMPPCDYGENRPAMPGAGDGRPELYDLLLGQQLRSGDRDSIVAVLRQRLPGEATDAFLAMLEAIPAETDRNEAIFRQIVQRHGGSADPELQVEVARARVALIGVWEDRHIGILMEDGFVWTASTWRETEAGRRWSAEVDSFLRDYRGRGERFDEFVAGMEMEALYRDAADRTPDDDTHDQRFLDPEDAEVRAWLLERLAEIAARYQASPQERVQRVVADAMEAQVAYIDWRRQGITADRALAARYREARDSHLRHEVGAALRRIAERLEEEGDPGATAAASELRAYEAAKLDIDCAPTPAP